MCETGEVRIATRPLRERSQRLAMQGDSPIGRKGLLHGEARKLVPEGDALRLGPQHPRRDALLEVVDYICGEDFEQPQLGLWRDDGNGFEQVSRCRVEPRNTREH